jgi:Second Messenger Oligonucleotide or Dinucleotide Synthetase domain
MGLVLDILNEEIRSKIAADEKVLEEARARRDLVAQAAMEIDGALRWFRSGSVAHGMVNKPVSDADSGIILDRRTYPTLGPDGDNEGPDEIISKLQELIGPKVREKYPNAKVRKSRRGLVVEFNERLSSGEDPSVDLIVTLTRKNADGLWIPDRDNDDWTPSHPEKHTELFTGGTKKLRALRARVARMAKAWNNQWDEGDRALSSFNIAALAWEYVQDDSVELDEALAGWFRYAHDELDKAETEDPARVSAPIRLLLTKSTVVRRLGSAADRLEHARANEDDEEAVRDDLATVYPDYVKPPAESKSALAAALRGGNEGVGMTKTGIAIGGTTWLKTTRSYGGERDG